MIYYYGPEYKINEVYNSTDKEFIQIVSCYDGDTCTSSEGEKIRLAHIDAPEKLCGIGGRPCPGGGFGEAIYSIFSEWVISVRRKL